MPKFILDICLGWNDKYILLRTMLYHIDECDGNCAWSDTSKDKEKLQVINKIPFNKVQ